jgi:hypothetical protein
MEDYREHDKEFSSLIKGKTFLVELSDYRFLKLESDP